MQRIRFYVWRIHTILRYRVKTGIWLPWHFEQMQASMDVVSTKELPLKEVNEKEKAEFKAQMQALNVPPTLGDLEAVLTMHIKEDLPNAKLVYFVYLSALTDSPMNALLVGESSTGKTWLQCCVASLFPSEQTVALRDRYITVKGFSSPTAFYHERGEYDRENREFVIKCFPKVYSFLDMPNQNLLNKMKTLLSHDAHEISFTYTDPNGRSRTVKMVGWPSVLYSTVDLKLTSELSNRQWIITPARCPEKWEAACALVAAREKNSVEFDRTVNEDPTFKKLRQWAGFMLTKARNEGPFHIQIHDEQAILNKFTEVAGKLQARSARDLARIFSLIKTITLFHGRNETTDSDVNEAFSIVSHIFECNIRGISPAVAAFHTDIIKPLQAETGLSHDIERQEIRRKYRQVYGEPLDRNRYDAYIQALEHHGLIELVPHPTHRSWQNIRPTLEESVKSNDFRVPTHMRIGTEITTFPQSEEPPAGAQGKQNIIPTVPEGVKKLELKNPLPCASIPIDPITPPGASIPTDPILHTPQIKYANIGMIAQVCGFRLSASKSSRKARQTKRRQPNESNGI
jgi:hypothetical protein